MNRSNDDRGDLLAQFLIIETLRLPPPNILWCFHKLKAKTFNPG